MRKHLPVTAALMLPLLIAGCTSTQIINLTPGEQVRNAAGLYPIEAVWKSNQTSVKEDTIKAYVIANFESYPMRPTPLVTNRWETLVPVPPDEDELYYYFKFDYEWQAFPERRPDSIKSPEYRLEIVEE